MRALYLDIVGGIAGDMTVAALIDLGVPLQLLREGLATLGVEGIAIDTESAARHQIVGTRFIVHNTADAGHGGHGHEHGHPHRPYREVRRIVEQAALPPGARERALAVFARLAEAEGRVHGVSVEDVEFHEVGAWDSIADVVCAALALEHLAPDALFCSTVPLGGGTVRSAHGVIPVPGPATLALLEGFPVVTGGPAYERTTPTGAAILAALARPAPDPFRFVPERTGIGIGSKDPPELPNLLRAVLGQADGPAPAAAVGALEEIECAEANLDDANPEWVGYLMDRLLAAGALDVVLLPAQMKKNRPGTLLQALYPPALRPRVEALLFAESTTLGVRYHRLERRALAREAVTVETPWGPVAGKAARFADRTHFSPEFEACRRIAEREGIPLRDVYRAAEAAWAEPHPPAPAPGGEGE